MYKLFIIFLALSCTSVKNFNEDNLRMYLERIIKEHDEKFNVNTFYIDSNNSELLNIYWEEAAIILFPERPVDPYIAIDPFFYYGECVQKGINLKTDVVPTNEDIKGSSFLVDKPYVEELIKTCKNSEITLTIKN
jgi:hypothetical protein